MTAKTRIDCLIKWHSGYITKMKRASETPNEALKMKNTSRKGSSDLSLLCAKLGNSSRLVLIRSRQKCLLMDVNGQPVMGPLTRDAR